MQVGPNKRAELQSELFVVCFSTCPWDAPAVSGKEHFASL
jgi:hypothetical protein